VKVKRRLLDIIIAFLILLIAESARGIVLPTLAPYVDMIGGDAVILGYAVAAFSIGRFASTIGLGYLSTRVSYGKVLGWSVFFCIVGNIMYSFGTIGGKYVLLTSRFISGFGAGTLSVVRAYVAHVTSHDERTSYMSILGAVQFLGFAITPGVGSLFSYLPTFSIIGIPFDKYTYPGWFLAIMNFLILVVLILEFKNPPPNDVVEITVSINGPVEPQPQETKKSMKVVKIFVVFLVLNLLVRLVLGIIETLGTPMYISVWNEGVSRATQAGFVFAAMGAIGVVVLFLISYLSAFVSDFKVLVVGLIFLTIGSGLLIGNHIGLTRFLLGAGLIWCIGFPLAQTIIVSMFSKSLGKAPQGTWMGWIGAMGSLGRILGPIGAGYLYYHKGQMWAMIFGGIMSVVSLWVVLFIIPKKKKPYPSI